jgi:hypothetical protein
MRQLSENVKEKLSETVRAWANEYLEERPAIIGQGVFDKLEEALLQIQEEIEEMFPR